MKKEVIIGSRESKLAVVQSEMVKAYIEKKNPGLKVQLLTMKTTGDIILDRTLDQIGGKGLFVKELDRALMEGRSHLSVHSLKDMPMETPEELPLLGFSKREDPRDALVLPEGASEMDASKPIGCSSLRRTLQLKKIFPNMRVESVRGNVQTRLRKLEEGQYSALVLAAAGLKRLNLEHRISRYFTVDEILPAAGQGILAVQGRADCSYEYMDGFFDADATYAALAERAFVRELDGGCSSPVAAHGVVVGDEIQITGLYYDQKTGNYYKERKTGPVNQAEALGISLAREMRMKTGKVWLVGAGPGDVGLFTQKGKQVLEQADVVVYDRLVGQGILTMIPENAQCIDVGKRAGNHTMPQEEINQVLLEQAMDGKQVVRLKGGDPFLFGRGGEELELLAENEVAFEVVPGITSSIAVPAYNGIPVTHRDFCSSLHIITGHKKAGQEYDINFKALVETKGTLVFLMGVTALADICKNLIEAGMEETMPAAILQQGTTAGQKRIVADIATLPEEVKRQGIETPAIIVVGKVCSLAEEFAWYEKQPLSGKRILVTRPKQLISVMAEKLRKLGAEVLELPAIRTETVKENEKLQESLKKLDSYDWIGFTSRIGVQVFFQEMNALGKDIRSLCGVKIAAIGAGTTEELRRRGLVADLVPEVYDGASMAEAMTATGSMGNARVLLPRAAAGNQELVDVLEKAGAQVDDVPIYETRYEKTGIIDEKAEFEAGKIDYAVFTSASTVKGFVEATPGLDYKLVKAVCIGKQTAAAAQKAGMKCFVAEKATMDSLAEKVVEAAANGQE